MTDRERLVDLISNTTQHCLECGCDVFDNACKYGSEERCEEKRIADYLLANGVVVLPCSVGDTVWSIVPIWMSKDKIQSKTYDSLFVILEDWYTGQFGKYIFLTREEAEEALKESNCLI